jgi:hypothetical protein
MRDPSKPDTQADEYMPDLPNAHKSGRNPKPDSEAINPRDTSSMPRGEDDAKTLADSPEFHDRTDVPGAGTATPPSAPR